ncbi:conserved exported protein of unknown function [Xenorhabdus poinarii G6]|uniref:Uncharacterized protein n=1 Tax=Xenorhabdus poinarii G6 TaxID=1354304 RepID=A0A068R261_9GAMM|nr:hypothetical protein [Xenorhabdus poinarii]CDG21367.1 conserved exported protein of unknown function [Xenorhabdus poinarii G6]
MTTHDRKACSAYLNLVCPPISNTLAATITNKDEEIISRLRQSHFYMICGRSKARFGKLQRWDEEGRIEVEIKLDSGLSSYGYIHIQKMVFFRNAPSNFKINVKGNDNFIIVLYEGEIVFHVTPDELLMLRGRFQPVFSGFDNYREIMTFDMLYVGIAKENQDSYSRLIARGHKARMDILAGEEQRTPGARVSDETYLLLFKIEPLTITTFSGPDDLDDEDLNFTIDYHRLVADAEKAVVNVFRPKYNKQQYVNYPKGKDGLYRQGYDGYSYSISEGMAFNTIYGTIKGARDTMGYFLSNDADFISVNGDEVTLHISGQDFNVEIEETQPEE